LDVKSTFLISSSKDVKIALLNTEQNQTFAEKQAENFHIYQF